MRKTFVMRGQTADDGTEILNFGKYKDGYAYKITEFKLYPSTSLMSNNVEMSGTITAGKTSVDPANPDFNNEGLIATAVWFNQQGAKFSGLVESIVDDTFVITQNLILRVKDSQSTPINWQCRFESVKMTKAEEAAVNYKQFSISDGS